MEDLRNDSIQQIVNVARKEGQIKAITEIREYYQNMVRNGIWNCSPMLMIDKLDCMLKEI